jgi:hypothetical protein
VKKPERRCGTGNWSQLLLYQGTTLQSLAVEPSLWQAKWAPKDAKAAKAVRGWWLEILTLSGAQWRWRCEGPMCVKCRIIVRRRLWAGTSYKAGRPSIGAPGLVARLVYRDPKVGISAVSIPCRRVKDAGASALHWLITYLSNAVVYLAKKQPRAGDAAEQTLRYDSEWVVRRPEVPKFAVYACAGREVWRDSVSFGLREGMNVLGIDAETKG